MQESRRVLLTTTKQVNEITKLTDEGIERAVLASLINDPSKVIECSIKLTSEDFTNPNNKYLYDIMLSMYKKHGIAKCNFDLSSIMSLADTTGAKDRFLEKAGGEEYIEFLNIVKSTMIDSNKFAFYIDRLLELSTKRKILGSTDLFRETIFSNDISASELAMHERTKLDAIMLESANREFELKNLATNIDSMIDKAMSKKVDIIGLRTGLRTLDRKIEGLKNGTLTIVAAPRKTGKSAFLMNIAIHNGVINKIPTLMISTEMSDEEMVWRTISNLSRVPQNKIIKGNASEKDILDIRKSALSFKQGNFFHLTMRGFTLEKIVGAVRKFINLNVGFNNDGTAKQCLIIFDYIKMPQADMKTARDLKEHKVLGLLSDGLKILAGELNIPLLTACQTNRAGDVANSYELTWFCDTFMELTKKSEKEMNENQSGGMYLGNQRLKIVANRSGDEDHKGIDLEFSGATLHYMDIDTSTN